MMKLTTLDNGLRVASRTMPGVETVAVGLYAEAGSRHEPARLNGIAHLFEHMVFKGAGGRSAREISEAIEDVGGDLNAATDRDGTSFTASLLAEHLPLGVELIADMILRPHFDADDLDAREGGRAPGAGRGARHAARHHLRRSLGGRLPRSAARPLDPRRRGEHRGDHASTISTTGGPSQYRAGSLSLVAAGKVDHDALVALAEARFGDLPDGRDRRRPSRRASPAATASAAPRADQAHLALGLCRRRRMLDPDYYAARLFADMVGGGASSRLFQAVREERGPRLFGLVVAPALSRCRPVLRLRGDRAARGGGGGRADRGGARRGGRRRRPSASSTGSGPRPRPAC